MPLIEPAKKAFTIGLIPAARSRPDIVLGLVTHLNSQKLYRESRISACDTGRQIIMGKCPCSLDTVRP